MKIARYIVEMLNLSKAEQAKFEASLKENAMSEVRSVPVITPQEQEVSGLPTEPNIPPDASYTFNRELNKPITDGEDSEQ